MLTRDVFDLKEGEKILIHVNEFCQPIKAFGGLLTRFMTLLLKEPNLCPRETKNWRECKTRCGIMLLVELRRRFNLPQTENMDKVLFSIFAQKFRTLKYRLKNMLFHLATNKLNEVDNIGEDGAHERQYTNDELLQALDLVGPPDGFANHQWELFKSNLRTSTAEKLSQYGKKARDDQVHNHTTGAVSFARKKDEFKLRHKREPYQVEFFGISHENKKKKGSYVKDTTREFMERAKLEISNKMLVVGYSETVDSEKRSEIERDVMEELMGPGRARGHGVGVTNSQVSKFSYELRRIRGEALTNENRAL